MRIFTLIVVAIALAAWLTEPWRKGHPYTKPAPEAAPEPRKPIRE
jgi:hypothetical protein